MTKKQRIQRLKSAKRTAGLLGAAAAISVPAALALPGLAGAASEQSVPVVLKSINSALANEYASKIKAGSSFQLDLTAIFEAADTLDYTVVVQNPNVADVKVAGSSLSINLKKTGSTMVDLIVRLPGQTASIHERFTLKVSANTALGSNISDIIKYFNAHAAELQSPSDFRTLLQAAVSTSVVEPNHAPKASEGTAAVELTAGSSSSIALSDLFSDEDGDELTYRLINPPSSGSFASASIDNATSTLVLNASSVSSQPLSVTVQASDGEASVMKQFSITAKAAPVVNHAPVASAASISVREDGAYTGNLNGVDADNDTLSYFVVTPPGRGVVTLDAGKPGRFTYTPSANANGTDSFTYKVFDGKAYSAEATVSVTITPVNDKPVAAGASIAVTVGNIAQGTLSGSDIEGSALTYSVVSQPTQGTLTVNAATGAYTYTPSATASGSDSFAYVVNDGTIDSDAVTVPITITAVAPANHKPVAVGASLFATAGKTASGNLAATDADSGDVLTYEIVTAPAGTLNLNAGTGAYTYTPLAGASGVDTFTYRVYDGKEYSDAATVTITIEAAPPVNHKPEAVGATLLATAGKQASGNLVATDADSGDVLTYEIVTAPTGTLNLNAGTGVYTYTPLAGASGVDTFTYRVYDGKEYSDAATVTITIEAAPPVNHKPEAVGATLLATAGKQASGNLVATDADSGDILTYEIVTAPTGTLNLNAGTGAYTYTPLAGESGVDTFTYRVYDGKEYSEAATVTITIEAAPPVNHKPEAVGATLLATAGKQASGNLVATDADSGDVLTYAIVTAPTGTLNLNAGTGAYTYTPLAGASGVDTFTYRVYDGKEYSDVATVTITIEAAPPVNHKPEAVGATLLATAGKQASGNLVATDADSGDILTYEIVTAPTGTLNLNAGTGAYTYTPQGTSGTDSFTYRVYDGKEYSDVATVTITIEAAPPVNHKPEAVGATLLATAGKQASGNLVATDADSGDVLTYEIVTAPTGTLNLNAGTGAYTYTPQGTSGTDSFTYRVYDGKEYSEAATVTITIEAAPPVNHKPEAVGATLLATAGKTANGNLAATDADSGDVLTYAIVTAPTGTLNLNAGTGAYTYTPQGTSGTDSFTFCVYDGKEYSEAATVTITIEAAPPVNHAPVANGLSVELNEDVPTVITLGGTDSDGDSLTYRIDDRPDHGMLTLITGELNKYTYTPYYDYNGPDSFTYFVNDGKVDSVSPATVSITVNDVNDPPIASEPFTINVLAGDTATGGLGGWDKENDPYSYIVTDEPEKGVLTVDPEHGYYSYQANESESGADSFTYKLFNSQGESAEVTVSINITVNHAPEANELTVELNEDEQTVITLGGTDSDGDSLSYRIQAWPDNGMLMLITGELNKYTYIPNADFNGSDSFAYVVNDGRVNSAEVVVPITIVPKQDKPTASTISIEIDEDGIASGSLSGYDVDGDALTYRLTSPSSTSLGQFSLNQATGAYTFTPTANAYGATSFTYVVNDGKEDSAETTISINVLPVNDKPQALVPSITVNRGQSTSGSLQGLDSDGDKLTFIQTEAPLQANLVLDPISGSYTLTAHQTASGTDSFKFKVYDGKVYSDVVTVPITITTDNARPVANPISIEMNEDDTYTVELGGTDANNDPLTRRIAKQPINGYIFPSSGSITSYTYIPNYGFSGTDSFTYVVNDGFVDSEVVTVSITIAAVNDAPHASPASISVWEDDVATGRLGAWDDEQDPLTFIVTSSPLNGTLTLENNGDYAYRPNLGYIGADSFTYKVNDGDRDSMEVTVPITVLDPNIPPIAGNTAFTVSSTGIYTGNLSGGDADQDSLTYSIDLEPGAGTVEIIDQRTGKFTYTPMEGVTGSDSFTYKVYDGKAYSNAGNVTVTIVNNEAPIAQGVELIVGAGQTKHGYLDATDEDADYENPDYVLTYVLDTPPAHGSVIMNEPEGGMFIYIPSPGYSGDDSFSYKAYDGLDYSESATVSIYVNPVPTASDASYPTLEDTSVAGQLPGEDDNGIIQYLIVDDPINGGVNLNQETGAFTYTPNMDFNGTDFFTYKVYDGTSYSEVKKITITVEPQPDPITKGEVDVDGVINIHMHAGQTAVLDLSQVFIDVDGDIEYMTSLSSQDMVVAKINGNELTLLAPTGTYSFTSFNLVASDDDFETFVSIPVHLEAGDLEGPSPDLPDVGLPNGELTYEIDVAPYFHGSYSYSVVGIDGGATLHSLEGSTLTLDLVPDDTSIVAISGTDNNGLTIIDYFYLDVGLGVRDIGVQFFGNYPEETYVSHSAYIYMKDIFHSANLFRVTDYNEAEIKSIGSYSLGSWTDNVDLSLWTDVTFSGVSEITVEGCASEEEAGCTPENVQSYVLQIRENTAPVVDGQEFMPIFIRKGDAAEVNIIDPDNDPNLIVDPQMDDSICGETGSCISTAYANGKLFVSGLEEGQTSLEIFTSDGLPFGDQYTYRTFVVHDADEIVDFSGSKFTEIKITNYVASLDQSEPLTVEVVGSSEMLAHYSDTTSTMQGDHFVDLEAVGSDWALPGIESITLKVTDWQGNSVEIDLLLFAPMILV
ncbi:Ig-like domain-containing protein [Paenibacillus silvisoli]|uniref:Ig-like domain-containing protein n=1 Tax=Paenibacillus silvisoli TaxID=3110539 RepID=UPI002803D2D3|nr:Ig-like domain-containing protein [Paenibacillus silvisoli]